MIAARHAEPEVRHLDREAVLDIHYALVAEFLDGDPIEPSGARSMDLLESALSRPRTSFAGREKYVSIEEKAAALFHSLVQNHPFHNGNKRTALVATLHFLDRNRRMLATRVPDDELYGVVTAVADRAFPDRSRDWGADEIVTALADWWRERLEKRGARPRSMRLSDFLDRAREAGARVNDGGDAWVVIGVSRRTIRIGKDTPQLAGQVVKNYAQRLGLAGLTATRYVAEFQDGVLPDGADHLILRFRGLLRRLANA